MNRFCTLALLGFALLLAVANPLNADAQRRLPREERGARAQIKKRAVKEARKEARRLAREDWEVAPGALPLEKQLERAWIMQYERTDRDELTYLRADGNGVANTYTAAQIQAHEMAKLNMAGQIQTEIRALVEANIANQQLTQEEAATVNRILTTSRNIIATRLNRVDPVFVIYRTLRNDNVEAQVMLVYDREAAIRAAGDVIRNELQRDLQDLSRRWDSILGLDVPPANTPAPTTTSNTSGN
jgi:hypothetical protein